MLRLVHQQQSLSWSGAAAPRQKSARVGALLELSCWRSTGSQITIVLRPVCLCAFVGRCGIFHVIPFWQVAMKRMPNLEYHYSARASVHYINTGMPGCSNFAHWLSLDQLTAIYIVLFNICKQFSDIYAYIHSYEGYCSSQQACFVLLGCFFLNARKNKLLGAWKPESNRDEELVRLQHGSNFEHHSEVPWGKIHIFMQFGWLLNIHLCTFYSSLSLLWFLKRLSFSRAFKNGQISWK